MLYHVLWGRYQQTAHNAEPFSESVIITNPIHPLYGQSLKVLSHRRWGSSTRVILSHPDGGTLSLAASETSWEIKTYPSEAQNNRPLFDPKKLLDLSQWLEKTSTPTPKKPSNCQSSQTVDKSKLDDETVKTSENRLKRIKRTPEAINQSDSKIGFQNAQPRNGRSS